MVLPFILQRLLKEARSMLAQQIDGFDIEGEFNTRFWKNPAYFQAVQKRMIPLCELTYSEGMVYIQSKK